MIISNHLLSLDSSFHSYVREIMRNHDIFQITNGYILVLNIAASLSMEEGEQERIQLSKYDGYNTNNNTNHN